LAPLCIQLKPNQGEKKMLIVDQEATALLAATVKADPETKIRALWTAQGVPEEMQNALIAGIAAKAQPGAQVGPFTIPVN
jgi:hypothetical protein